MPEDSDVHRVLRWYWQDHAFPDFPLRERVSIERHNLATLDGHLREFEPAVVNWWAMGGMSMSLIGRVSRLEIPAVGVVVDEWPLYGPKVDAWQRATRRAGPIGAVANRLLRVPSPHDVGGAANWVFVSEMVRESARRAGWSVDGSVIAAGGIDPARFPQAPERPWSGRLLYLGRIDRRKGIATAVKALAHLPDAVLDVIGTGDDAHERDLRGLVSALGLEQRVRFSRLAHDAVAAAYAAADAVLFPVLWAEPWGLVPLEAMAVGRPVIGTGTGGSGEYLVDGENCLLFRPPDDPRALADAVRHLSDDPELRRRLRAGGFATAKRFTDDAFNRAVEAALAQAIA
jgi:glycosyltransferase involved in cell wall biosynthesis